MSTDTFSLLDRPWIPALRGSGTHATIRPADITSRVDDDPIIAIAWGRPDLDAASREFLVGLLATACGVDARDRWRAWFNNPPALEVLDAAFAPLAPAFVLDGSGSRFQQDLEPLPKAKQWPIRELLIDARETYFNKERPEFCLCRGAAAIALHALQSYAPEGGRGHFVSLRGGGPLTTILVPGIDDGAAESLWQRLWLNVPARAGEADDPETALDLNRIFPWLVPTRSNADGTTTTPVEIDELQAFWGMPRRIRLQFAPNEQSTPCSLTGEVDTVIARAYEAEGKGTKYEGIDHPLSPYRRDAPNAPWRAMRTPEGRVGYRYWSALVVSPREPTSLTKPARILVSARERLRKAGSPAVRFGARLLASGYRTQQNKAREFVESEMPMHLFADEKLFAEYSSTVESMVGGAREAATVLRINVQRALFGDNPPSDGGKIADARERFWDRTDPMFGDILASLAQKLENSDEASDRDIRHDAREEWLCALRVTTEKLFDEFVPQTDFGILDIKNLERRIDARRALRSALRGYGKFGQGLFKSLQLPPPEPAKAGRKSDPAIPQPLKPRRKKATAA